MFRSSWAGIARTFSNRPHAAHNRAAPIEIGAGCLQEVGRLNIPVAKLDAAELIGCDLIERGRYLARQDQWLTLSSEMQAADQARDVAPDGLPAADLLAFGARSDVVLAAEHALSEGRAIRDYDLLAGISELECEI